MSVFGLAAKITPTKLEKATFKIMFYSPTIFLLITYFNKRFISLVATLNVENYKQMYRFFFVNVCYISDLIHCSFLRTTTVINIIEVQILT